ERCQHRLDVGSGDGPGRVGVLEVVLPCEVVAPVVEATVDEQAVLGLPGPVGPLPADLQPEPPAGRVAAAGAPVPRHRVGPHTPAAVEHAPPGDDRLALAVDLDGAAEGAGQLLERVL